tara:strand:+ start:11250 stop:11708 length:459 start_codon:yes stop_codon:yes gene_type:complete
MCRTDSVDVVEYKAEHLARLDVQDGQLHHMQFVSAEQAAALVDGDWAQSCVEDGRVYGCAGIVPLWPGRALAWSYISIHTTGSKFLAVHRAVLRRLDACHIRRIEMTVDCDFVQGHRWAELLGFVMEAPRMMGYFPNGTDCALYARVRTGGG